MLGGLLGVDVEEGLAHGEHGVGEGVQHALGRGGLGLLEAVVEPLVGARRVGVAHAPEQREGGLAGGRDAAQVLDHGVEGEVGGRQRLADGGVDAGELRQLALRGRVEVVPLPPGHLGAHVRAVRQHERLAGRPQARRHAQQRPRLQRRAVGLRGCRRRPPRVAHHHRAQRLGGRQPLQRRQRVQPFAHVAARVDSGPAGRRRRRGVAEEGQEVRGRLLGRHGVEGPEHALHHRREHVLEGHAGVALLDPRHQLPQQSGRELPPAQQRHQRRRVRPGVAAPHARGGEGEHHVPGEGEGARGERECAAEGVAAPRQRDARHRVTHESSTSHTCSRAVDRARLQSSGVMPRGRPGGAPAANSFCARS